MLKKIYIYNIRIYMSINNRFIFLSILIALALLLPLYNSRQLNSFNLLFPTAYLQDKGHVKHIVITSGGCYDWQSSNTDIVKVQGTHQGLAPLQSSSTNSNCNSNAIVEVSMTGQYLSPVHITAKNLQNKQIMTIPVRIRGLKKISIFTKSRSMNVNEVQILEIYGFDQENNTFTSLQGLRFSWNLVEQADGSNGQVEFIKLQDSKMYMPLDTRKKIQINGRTEKIYSDMLLIKATRVGKVKIKVRCIQPNYSYVSYELNLFVQEKFTILPPSGLQIIAGSRIRYNLYTSSQQIIKSPSDNYVFQLSDNSFRVDSNLQVHAPSIDSQTKLSVYDFRVSPPYKEQVIIYSYKPDLIQIIICQIFVDGQQKQFEVKFYRKNKELKGNVNPRLVDIRAVESPSVSGFPVFSIDKGNSRIKALNKGSAVLYVEYQGLVGMKTIYSSTPIKVVSAQEAIILPIGEIYQINVIGGSNSYKYSYNSQEQPVITLSLNGLVTTRLQGIAQVSISDEKNANNVAKIKIIVAKVWKMHSFEERKQLNLYGDGTLYLGAQPKPVFIGQKQLSQFTECNDGLLKGLEVNNGEGNIARQIEIHRVDQISSQSLKQFEEMGEYSEEIANLLKKKQFNRWVQNYSIYIKYKQISQSQLYGLFKDLENYGICAKVHIKAIEPFAGNIQIKKMFKDGYTSSTASIQLRVYQLMQSHLAQSNNHNQVFLVPKSSLKWVTKGGPYKWDSNEDFQVYLDGRKMDPESSKNFSDYIYPTISCIKQQLNQQKHYLKYMNKKSSTLLRPVEQSIEIKLKCVQPKALRLGLPNKNNKLINSKRVLPEDLKNLNYFIPTTQFSTVYILPKQSFLISVQPLSNQESHSTKNHFFNSSSLVINMVSNGSQMKYLTQLDTQFGQRTYLYDGCGHLEANKVTEISVVVKQIRDQKTNQLFELVEPLVHRIRVITLQQLKFEKDLGLSVPIQIVNVPSSYQIIKFQGIDQDRISVRCNEKILKCSLISSSQIRVQSQQIQKSMATEIIVRDELTLENKEISIPVKIQAMSGIDLWIESKKFINSFKRDERFLRIDKSKLSGNSWIFDGQQFVILADLYTFSLQNGKSQKQSLKKINPKLIEVNFDRIPTEKIEETGRHYDPYNDLIFISFRLPKLFNPSSSSSSFNAKFSAYIKQKNNQVISSNTVNLEIYDHLSISTAENSMPLSLSKDSAGKTILNGKISIMESCSATINVKGGSEQIKIAVLLLNMKADYFQVTQLERKFYIQTIESTEKLEQKGFEQITGKEGNILNLGVYLMNKYTNIEQQIYVLRILVEIPPIQNIQILGNDHLISGQQIRYRVSFSQPSVEFRKYTIFKQSCSLKYKWDLSPYSNALVSITSNPQRESVNLKSGPAPQKQSIKSSQVVLIVNIYHKGGALIGRNSKIIKIYEYQNITLFESSDRKSCNENEFLLIPPLSGLRLSSNILLSKIAKDQNSRIQIFESNLITSKQVSQYPQLIKVQQNILGRPIATIPIFAKVLVSDICGVFIENTDGIILVNPKNFENLKASNYLFHFYLIDCFGRRFSHFDYENLQYRVSTVNPQVAFAYLQDLKKGLVKVNPYKLGETKLIFQVFLRGAHKVKEIIPIQISIYIQPSQAISIHIGDYLKFKGPSVLKEQWVSSNNRIVSINSKSGQAIGQQEGEASIKFGSMSTQVSVIKIIQLLQYNREENEYSDLGFEYQLVYRGKKYLNEEDSSSVESRLKWTCQIVGEQSKYLEAQATVAKKNGKDIVGCQIKRKMQALEIQRTIRYIKLIVTCQNRDRRFKFSRQFTEQLGDSFVILTEKHINPKNPLFMEKNTATITIQSSQRLDKYQKGPLSDCILQEQFNGNKYSVTVDLSKYVEGEWRITFVNPRTKQKDFVIISKDKVSQQQNNAVNESQRWKWTDFVVLAMAINFLAILFYQVFIANKNGKLKSS